MKVLDIIGELMYLKISHEPPILFFTALNHTFLHKIDVKIRNVEMTSHDKTLLQSQSTECRTISEKRFSLET